MAGWLFGACTTSDMVDPDPRVGEVLVGAGDIAECGLQSDEATADLLDGIPGTVFTAGDNVYDDGTAQEFQDCYEPSWGRHKARTRPSAGNHDYNTPDATGYYAYFGSAAGNPDEGYYSYDLGSWHVVVLNSNIPRELGSPQIDWLINDLASTSAECTVAYWHHPRFTSGFHRNDESMAAMWDALYAAGAEIVINGHDHHYERFAPQDPAGQPDPDMGIREFVVGTGGTDLFPAIFLASNSEVRNASTFGVLKLTLYDGAYDWEFVPVVGQSFTDSGSEVCH
ncbi:MAG: metallophosphoesterase family protein [Longimicrobiales bacterium]